MPSSPSMPNIPAKVETKPVIPPKPKAAALETEREAIRQSAKKRKGYASTALTSGTELGVASTSKGKAQRLGLTS
jgi:hypothetical protein